MNPSDYQERALATCFPEGLNQGNAYLGLIGETGELAEQIKKWKYQRKPLNAEEIASECGDVMWYLALTHKVLRIPMQEEFLVGIAEGDAEALIFEFASQVGLLLGASARSRPWILKRLWELFSDIVATLWRDGKMTTEVLGSLNILKLRRRYGKEG